MRNQRKRQESKGKIGRAAFCLRFVLLFALCPLAFAFPGLAQDDPPDSAPPPIKILSKDERSRLTAKTDIKDRTKLSVEMMKTRMISAEMFASNRNFEGMYNELGNFHALMDDALDFLSRNDNGSGKVLDNFKRLELALRMFAPKIEVMRRELPLKYDPYLKRLLTLLREARAKATDSLFDDTVLPRKKPGT